MSWNKRSIALLGINLSGALGYVIAASHGGWAIPEERAARIVTTTGEPFVWFTHVLPFIIAFVAIDFAWAIWIVRKRQWQHGLSWLTTAAIWIAAIVVDFAHH